MNKLQQTVMSMLKPKVKAFGFSKKVVKSIAAEIADKLDIEEDASDEDVNAKIEVAIAAVLPFMPMIQSQANSQLDEWKKAQTQNDDEDEEEDDDPKSKSVSKSTKNKDKKTDEIPAWAQALIDSNKTLNDQLAAIKGEKITDTRRAKLGTLLKGTKSFGDSKLRDFRRMKFDTDEDFDEFYAEVEADLKTFNQERANAGLEKLGLPVGGVKTKQKEDKPEVLSEEEIKAIAAM